MAVDVQAWIAELLPSDFERSEHRNGFFFLPETPILCQIGIESAGPPFHDRWSLVLDVGAPAPFQPDWPDDFRESWFCAGVVDQAVKHFDSLTVDESCWHESQKDDLWASTDSIGVPWLRRMRDLEYLRNFLERILFGPPAEAAETLVDEPLVSVFRGGMRPHLFLKNLGLVCRWMGDLNAALQHLTRYRDILVESYKPVADPDIDRANVARVKLVQGALDEIQDELEDD